MHCSGFTNTLISKVVWRYINILYLPISTIARWYGCSWTRRISIFLKRFWKERSDLSTTTLLVINVCFLNNIKTSLFALSLCDALHSKCLNVWMVWAQAILRLCSKWTWILMIWETIKNLSNHVLKPRFMGSAQSDITEPTYGICCPFNIKTAWMFMISENYCLHGMDRITSTQVMVYHWWIPCETLVHNDSR